MTDSSQSEQYVVVARRYRPQSFEQLVGQQNISQALANAINTNRVGHAYLFTGARGVGKTSTARILAKCLNCNAGPSPQPCGTCDACESITSGEDVDVLEIDGASNRGIDEIRQLRSNVNIRPSRSRYKVYIIDEVHMLTTPAFNALLKTLEEPPEHVKFIFCTTDPEKIPITVLSRCQRFDFAPVESESIVARLKHIVQSEGMQADDDALHLLARRANGSMRDSQSLLEQLLAFSDDKISLDHVHRMLGTADSGEISALVASLINRDTAAALTKVDELISAGGDAGQLTEQLLGWTRDMMAATVGCDQDMMLNSGPSDFNTVSESGKQLGLETSLAVAQILDETLTRMRQSTHVRTLLDIAIVRISKLEDLDDLAGLIAQVASGKLPAVVKQPTPRQVSTSQAKPLETQKKSDLPEKSPKQSTTSPTKTVEVNDENIRSIWQQAVETLEDTAADFASSFESIAISAPNQLAVSFKAEYTLHKERCERPELKSRLERSLEEITGQRFRIDFRVLPAEQTQPQSRQPVMSKRQRMRELEKHPLVQEAIDTFDAEVVDIKPPRNQ